MGSSDTRHTHHQGPVGDILTNVAFWQGVTFLMLVLLVWASEALDLPALIYDAPPSPIDWFGASILTAAVIVIGFVSVAQTYVQQQRILKGFILVCAHCRRVRLGETSWERLEEFVEGKTLAEFTHGICSDCYDREMERDSGPDVPVFKDKAAETE